MCQLLPLSTHILPMQNCKKSGRSHRQPNGLPKVLAEAFFYFDYVPFILAPLRADTTYDFSLEKVCPFSVLLLVIVRRFAVHETETQIS
jgi:hypothetical protein